MQYQWIIVRQPSTPYTTRNDNQERSFVFTIMNPSANRITKAIDTEPTSPEKHLAHLRKLKKQKTISASNTVLTRLLITNVVELL